MPHKHMSQLQQLSTLTYKNTNVDKYRNFRFILHSPIIKFKYVIFQNVNGQPSYDGSSNVFKNPPQIYMIDCYQNKLYHVFIFSIQFPQSHSKPIP